MQNHTIVSAMFMGYIKVIMTKKTKRRADIYIYMCVCVSQTLFLRAVHVCVFFCRIFSFNVPNRGTAWLVTWQSNEEAVTSHWHGFWTQNPRTCSEVKNSHFSIFRIFSYHGKVAKPKTTHVYPCGPRQHKAFLGIFPLSRRVLKPTTTCDAVFQVCFGSGSIMVRSWSWFYQASEVLQLVDLLAGSDALTVSCVCPCQAPATGQVCSSSVCQVQYLVLLLKWREWSHVAFESIGWFATHELSGRIDCHFLASDWTTC